MGAERTGKRAVALHNLAEVGKVRGRDIDAPEEERIKVELLALAFSKFLSKKTTCVRWVIAQETRTGAPPNLNLRRPISRLCAHEGLLVGHACSCANGH